MNQPLGLSICAMWLVVSLTTVGACDDGKLNESTARELIGQPGRPIGENGAIGIVWLGLVHSPFWKNGEAAMLTVNNCWVLEQQPIRDPEWYVSDGAIAPHCPDIADAVLFFSRESKNWYAKEVRLITYRPKIDQIVEILTRDDQATVKYTVGWSETELFRKWRNAEPAYFSELSKPATGVIADLYVPPDFSPPPPVHRTACLRKYDQGWRLCE